ncbi:MAG TPA: inorganic diphosphatase [Gemmatimonadaceae bacterium]|nr:inorganic diphosphatase [Gemmatimonadaceae bacterium]
MSKKDKTKRKSERADGQKRRFTPLTELPSFSKEDDDGLYNIVIETPKGSPNKLAYDPDLGAFKLKAVLPEGSNFPFDFGFIPSTLADDGDPLDVLVLMDHPLVPGSIVPSRLIGVIDGKQTERDGDTEENDRLIAVSPESATYQKTKNISDLPRELVEQVEQFFINYNDQRGKKFVPKGQHGPKRAEDRVDQARKNFRKR